MALLLCGLVLIALARMKERGRIFNFMNIIVICVYNREQNIKQWLHCWRQCNSTAKLAIIHNVDGDECYDVPDDVMYIRRPNVGFDIGAFQDVCMNRLFNFPQLWDKLLWIADDTLPMQKDFDKPFWDALEHSACAAMEISPFVKKHIRTTGFAITKKISETLTFPAYPVTTKEECYQFEHKSPQAIYEQIISVGGNVVQVADNRMSPLFDTGYHRRLKEREAQHYQIFGRPGEKPITEATVCFICPAYNAHPYIIESLLAQTHKNWKLYLVHDGPNETGLKEYVSSINDERIIYHETETRSSNWGHSIRSEWLQKAEGDYVVITNQDNYHVPVFIEYMLKGFSPGIIATYCSDMVHSYKAWQVIRCSLRRGYLDCAGVMVKLDKAKACGWNDVTSHSADWFYFADLIKKYTPHSFKIIPGCLLIHN